MGKDEIISTDKEKKLNGKILFNKNRYSAFLLVTCIVMGYFYFTKDYTPKIIFTRENYVKKIIQQKLYIYYPKDDKLADEEIIFDSSYSSNKIIKSTIEFIILKLENMEKIPKIDTNKEIGYFVLEDKVFLNVPEKIFDKIKSPREELLLIYSFVNSLTNIEGVENIRFLINNVDVEKVKYSNLLKDYNYKKDI